MFHHTDYDMLTITSYANSHTHTNANMIIPYHDIYHSRGTEIFKQCGLANNICVYCTCIWVFTVTCTCTSSQRSNDNRGDSHNKNRSSSSKTGDLSLSRGGRREDPLVESLIGQSTQSLQHMHEQKTHTLGICAVNTYIIHLPRSIVQIGQTNT